MSGYDAADQTVLRTASSVDFTALCPTWANSSGCIFHSCYIYIFLNPGFLCLFMEGTCSYTELHPWPNNCYFLRVRLGFWWCSQTFWQAQGPCVDQGLNWGQSHAAQARYPLCYLFVPEWLHKAINLSSHCFLGSGSEVTTLMYLERYFPLIKSSRQAVSLGGTFISSFFNTSYIHECWRLSPVHYARGAWAQPWAKSLAHTP